MRLRSLTLSGARNLVDQSLEFEPGINWLVGPNGAGKSSLVECVGVAATSRSFRTTESAPFIRFGDDTAVLSSEFEDDAGNRHQSGVMRSRKGVSVVKWDGDVLRRASELASQVPVYTFDAGLTQRLFLGAAGRRALLDWGAFHVEQGFAECSRASRAALDQRNALLRTTRDATQLDFWDRSFAEVAERVEALREAYLRDWLPRVLPIAVRFGLEVEMDYRRGWDGSRPLLEILADDRESDLRSGRTAHGPHRSDLRVLHHGTPARDSLSRGQQKALAAALVLGQIAVRCATHGTKPIALIDDLTAELDFERAATVVESIREFGIQAFCAAVDLPEALVEPRQDAVFLLRAGRAQRVSPGVSGESD